MKIYKTKPGILIEQDDQFYLLENEDWDSFLNDDALSAKIEKKIADRAPIENGEDLLESDLLAPIQNQEIWASGVTYFNSKLGREEESKESGGSVFYSRVYLADRPELFFKATAHRTVGHRGRVNIREDSTWDVPEPELTLVITSNGKIVGYTVGNDMSSRSIEGENLLYLPQAKTFDNCASIGPGIYVTDDPLPPDTMIHLQIRRDKEIVFYGKIGIDQMKRKPEELVEYLFRACSFPYGCFLMTGTGIVPGNDFTLQKNDEISIIIDHIGTLKNIVN